MEHGMERIQSENLWWGNCATGEAGPRHLRKKKGQRQGKGVPPESVVKCEECHVIILDTVQRTV